MVTTESLLHEIAEYLVKADEKTLRMVQAVIYVELSPDWNDMPEEVKRLIDESMKEADEGKGISHEEFVKQHPEWFGTLKAEKRIPLTFAETLREEITELIGAVNDNTLRMVRAILEVHEEYSKDRER